MTDCVLLLVTKFCFNADDKLFLTSMSNGVSFARIGTVRKAD